MKTFSFKRDAFTLIELLIVIAIIAILALIAIPNFIEAQTRAKVSRCHADMRAVATAIETYFVDHNAYPVLNKAFGNTSTAVGYRRLMYNNWLYWNRTTGGYPPNNQPQSCLSTPVAYLTNAPTDPFQPERWTPSTNMYPDSNNFSYLLINFHGAAADSAVWEDWEEGPGKPVVPQTPLRLIQGGPVRYSTWLLVGAGPNRGIDTDSSTTNNIGGCFADRGHYNALCLGYCEQPYDPTNGMQSEGNIYRVQSGTSGE